MDQMVKRSILLNIRIQKRNDRKLDQTSGQQLGIGIARSAAEPGVAALGCGVSLSVYAVATAVRKNLYVNALIAAAIFILLGIFSLTAPKRSAKHTIKTTKAFSGSRWLAHSI